MNAEIQHAHDMLMHQVGDSARLGEEAISVVNCQSGVEYLDGDLRSQVDMLAQIDVRESSAINQANDAIVANLLHRAVCHAQCSLTRQPTRLSVRFKDSRSLLWTCQGHHPGCLPEMSCHFEQDF